MKVAIIVLISLVFFSSQIFSQYKKIVDVNQLDEITIKYKGLLFNNFNLAFGKAFFGGHKVTFQVSTKNKTDSDVNYTVYIGAFNHKGEYIFGFNLEPSFNIHEKGKLEIIETSGLINPGDKDRIKKVGIIIYKQNK